MGRLPKKETILDLGIMAEQLAEKIKSMSMIIPENANTEIVQCFVSEMKQARADLQSISKRFRRLHNLIEHSAGNYVVVGDDGELRTATPEEVTRIVMGYPPKMSFFEILRKLTVTPDGEHWMEKPDVDNKIIK